MTPDEVLAFLSVAAARAGKGLELAASTNNFELVALNVRQLFKCHLVRGLIQWRQGREPTGELTAALELVRENLRARPELRDRVPVARACILAALLGQPSPTSSAAPPGASPEESLDLSLALRANGRNGAERNLADSALSALASSPRTRLAAESYSNYLETLSANGDDAALRELASKGEALYVQRAADGYFAGGEQSEGGGQDNKLVVDYRLALAFKVAGYREVSIHAWTWSTSP